MEYKEQDIRNLVADILAGIESGAKGAAAGVCCDPFPVEISARHVHLTKEAVEVLFGKGYELKKKKDLSQPGEFLSEERVKLVTAKGQFANVAVLGPVRKAVQVELSATDAVSLGIKAPVSLSGNLNGAGDVLIIGPAGCLEAKGSVIIARAHVHMTPADAKHYGVKDGQSMSVRIASERPLTLENVIVRVREDMALAMHIDFDEGNAGLVKSGATGCFVSCGGMQVCNTCTPAGAAPAAASEYTSDKKLIVEADAKEIKGKGVKIARFAKGTIITPAARDIFTNARIEIKTDL